MKLFVFLVAILFITLPYKYEVREFFKPGGAECGMLGQLPRNQWNAYTIHESKQFDSRAKAVAWLSTQGCTVAGKRQTAEIE